MRHRLLLCLAAALLLTSIPGLAVPLQPSFTSCLSAYSPQAPYGQQLVVEQVYANLVSKQDAGAQGLVGGGRRAVIRVDVVGQARGEVLGYDNSTNKLATLFSETTVGSINVFSQTSWLCNSIFPPQLPTPYYPLNTSYCPLAAGPFALNLSVPLYRSYALTTLSTRVRIVDTTLSANTLACYDIGLTPYAKKGWYYGLFLWLPVAVAVAFWAVTWGARFAAGWVVGSGVAEYDTKEGAGSRSRVDLAGTGGTRRQRREATMRKWGTMVVSGLSGERLSVSGGLLRFVTPGLRDVIYHIQFCAMLGMIAISWPGFAYPIITRTAWADLVWNTTLVQGANPLSKRPSAYPTEYTPPTAFSTQMTDPQYPLYLDSSSFNPLLDIYDAKPGMASFAAALGLRSQDLFGTCLVIFLLLTLSVALLSLLIWLAHGLTELFTMQNHVATTANKGWRSSTGSSPGHSITTSDKLYDQGSYGFGPGESSRVLPTQGTLAAAQQQQHHASPQHRSNAPSRFRRTWWRFRPKGEAGAFHAAALYGNLLRMIFLFHLPITTFSMYQLTLSHASIVSRVFAALSFVFLSVLIPAGIMFKVSRTPSGKLYDATRTLLSLGTVYNVYVEGKQMFRVFPLAASLVAGVVVGAGQGSGIAQAVILVLIELTMLIVPAVWYPWGEGASMGAPSAVLGVLRVASMVMVMILSPALAMDEPTLVWVAYAVLLLQAIAYLFLIFVLFTKIVEAAIRLVGGVHFDDESTHPLDGGLFAAIMDLDCLNGVRGGKAAQRKRRKRGSRQLQRNVSAAGSLTTQMMLDRHSQGVQRPPQSEGNTPFLSNYPQLQQETPSYFPGHQPPLGPPPLERHSSDSRSDEPSHVGHIMDAWRPPSQSALPNYGPPVGYMPTATTPQVDYTRQSAGPSATGRSFNVLSGAQATMDNPYAPVPVASPINEQAYPTRAMSPPAIRVSPMPVADRRRSSQAAVELAPSPPASPLYSPGHVTGVRPNQQGLRPPLLAIPKRRSLNNLKESPTSTGKEDEEDASPRGKKGKLAWFRGKDGQERSAEDTSSTDDEPGPSSPRRKKVRKASQLVEPKPFEPVPMSPLLDDEEDDEAARQGWRGMLGLGGRKKKHQRDSIAEQVRDENKARKAALAAESGSLFAGVEKPPLLPGPGGEGKSFRVKNRKAGAPSAKTGLGISGSGVPTAGGGPIMVPLAGGGGEGGEENRSFRVKRMGKTPEPIAVRNAPQGQSISPADASPNPSVGAGSGEPQRSFRVLRHGLLGTASAHASSASASASGQSTPSSYSNGNGNGRDEKQRRSFVVKRQSTQSTAGGGGGGGGGGGSSVPQTPQTAQIGYPPSSFVAVSPPRGAGGAAGGGEEGRKSWDGRGPYVPPKNPRRQSQDGL